MKKQILFALCMLLLSGCANTDNRVEETDIITEIKLQTTAAEITEITETETSSLPGGVTDVVIDMADDNAPSYTADLHDLQSAEIHNCGSADLDFLRDSGINQLTIHGFTGRAADYEELFRSLDLISLFIYAKPGNYYETDREIYESCVREGGQCVYSDTNTVIIGGNSFPVNADHILLDAESLSEKDCESINMLESPNLIIENVMDKDLGFLSECPNIESIVLEDFNGSTDSYSELFSKLPKLKSVSAAALSFSSEQADSFMLSAPGCAFEYYGSGTSSSENPDSGVHYFIPPSAYIGDSFLPVYFSNFTDSAHTVEELRIYRENGSEWEPVSFTDGSDHLTVNFDIPPHTDSTFGEHNWAISADAFDLQSAVPGKYRTVFTIDGADSEMEFIINSLISSDEYPKGCAEHMDFLNSEQKEAFESALAVTDTLEGCSADISSEYVQTHTAEDFLNEYCSALTYECALDKARKAGVIDENGQLHAFSGGRGSIITSSGELFIPLYSDENEVLFKNVNIHWHGDFPYERWYHEYNYHMIKTEDGWKFDVFRIWY